jgi:hypothetical protein
MASFTDAISTFNPYVSQLPVIEEMSKVGMERQGKYDQGIQKIQGQIDNVAGMDVIKGEHKAYLQTKLNELGSNLKKVAASDFSNFQLVNSVGGMASQIIKDPTIEGAVYSTQKFRKEQAKQEAAQKAGKSSPENEWYFNNQFQSWLGNKDINSRFNGEYVQYTDVNKKLNDVVDKVHEADNSIDQPNMRDAQGNTLYYKTVEVTDAKGKKVPQTTVSTDPQSGGQTRIDDVMLRIKTKGKSAEKILNTFYDNLDENDKRQLMITGAYHYKGATADTFKKDIIGNYDANKKILSDAIVDMSVELVSNTKLTTVQKAEITANIGKLNKKLSSGTLEAGLQKDLSGINNIPNIEDYKGKLYSQKYLTKFAQDRAYQDKQTELLTNPYFQADMEKKTLQFRYDDANRQQKNFNADYALKVKNAEFEHLKWETEQTNKAAEKLLNAPVVTPGAISTDIDTPSLGKLNTTIEATQKAINNLNADYANTLFPNITNVDEKKGAIAKLVQEYTLNPKVSTSPAMTEYLERRRAFDIKLGQQQGLYSSAAKESSMFDKQIDQYLAGKSGIINTKTGKQLFSSKDLFIVDSDFADFGGRASPSYGSVASSGMGKTFNEVGFLNKYKGTPQENIAIAFLKRRKGQPLTSTEQVVVDQARTIGEEVSPIVKNLINQKLTFETNYLNARMPERQTQIGTISASNKQDNDRIGQLIGTKLQQATELGGVNVRDKEDFNAATIEKVRKDPNATYTIQKKYDGSANLIMNGAGVRQVVPMDSGEFAAFFPKYAVSNPINEIKYAVLASPNHTTNLKGGADGSNAINAYMSGHDIPGLANTAIAPLVRLDVEGSPNNDGGDHDKFVVRMYAYDGNVWKTTTLNQQRYVTEDGITAIINNIGTHTYDDVLKQTK